MASASDSGIESVINEVLGYDISLEKLLWELCPVYFKVKCENDFITTVQVETSEEDRDKYLANVNIVNFDIINHQLKGTPLENSITNYKTIYKKDLKQIPANDKDAALAACFRSYRKDLNVEKELRDEYFRTWYNSSSSSHLANSSSSSCKKTCTKNFGKDKEALQKKNQKYFDCW